MFVTYVLEVLIVFCFFFQWPFSFLKSHCKLAHLSGMFSTLRFLLALPVQSLFHGSEQPSL